MSEHDDERPAEVLRTKRLVTGAEMSESMPGEMRACLLSRSPVRAAGQTLRYAVVIAGGHAGRRRCR
jgi:hypothetical protein